MRCDKYFIEELQKQGYEINFKTLINIYQKSRENPDFIKRRTRKELSKGYFAWNHDTVKWEKISKKDYEKRKTTEDKNLENIAYIWY